MVFSRPAAKDIVPGAGATGMTQGAVSDHRSGRASLEKPRRPPEGKGQKWGWDLSRQELPTRHVNEWTVAGRGGICREQTGRAGWAAMLHVGERAASLRTRAVSHEGAALLGGPGLAFALPFTHYFHEHVCPRVWGCRGKCDESLLGVRLPHTGRNSFLQVLGPELPLSEQSIALGDASAWSLLSGPQCPYRC